MALTAKQKRNLRKWVEALESGEYRQTTGDLRHVSAFGESFCCLGVWCEVAVAGSWVEDSGTYSPRRKGVDWLDEGDIAPIRGDLGLSEKEEKRLISLNDAGNDFLTIAAKIRKDHPEAFA